MTSKTAPSILTFALVLAGLASPKTQAQTQSCADQTDDQKIISCLNHSAARAFHAGGSRSLESQFYIDFLALTEAQKLKVLEAPASLSNSFSIEIPRTKDLLDLNSPACFSFETGVLERIQGQSKESRVQVISSQMQHAALFLKHIHLLSLGQESSVLFPLRRIEICSNDTLKHEYSKGVLRLGIDSNSRKILSARELFDLWTSGDLVFGAKPGLLESAQHYFHKDVNSILNDKMRALWPLLNPTGDARFRLRVLLQKYLSESKQKIASENFESFFRDQSRKFGFQSIALSTENQNELQKRWLQNLSDSAFVTQLAEQALVQTHFRVTNTINNDHRRNFGLINVKNNKQITVDINGLFTQVYPFEATNQERRIESHSLQVGLVNIDLIDQVSVDLSIPAGIPEWIEKTTLQKTLAETGL